MRRAFILCAVAALAVAGCKKKAAPAPAPAKGAGASAGQDKPSDNVGFKPIKPMPTDTLYAKGKVKVATMELLSMVEQPDQAPEGAKGGPSDEALEKSVVNQGLMINGERGKLLFNTPDWFIPTSTEIRYDPKSKRYLLCDVNKEKYWLMSGPELGALLEGGPRTGRSEYEVNFHPPSEARQEVLGYQAKVTEAELAFDWRVELKTGSRTGRVRVSLTILHTDDKRLPVAWKDVLIDFLTLPFQDKQGTLAVAKIKNRIGFPLRWQMTVINEGQKRAKEDRPPSLITQVVELKIQEVERSDMAFPPVGFAPAQQPFEYAEGGQTLSKELMGKLPASPGKGPGTIKEGEGKGEIEGEGEEEGKGRGKGKGKGGEGSISTKEALEDGDRAALRVRNRTPFMVIMHIAGVRVGWMRPHRTGLLRGLVSGNHKVSANSRFGSMSWGPREIWVPGTWNLLY